MKKEIETAGVTNNRAIKTQKFMQRLSILFGTMTLVWTLVIFSFSMQPAYKSAKVSEGLLEKILKFIQILTHISINPVPICDLFRKAAHFTEFFVLGALSSLFCHFIIYDFKIKNTDLEHKFSPYLYSLLYGVTIAVSDEILQFFIGAGRSMQFTDMLIDSSGVIVALLMIWKLYKHFNKNGGFWLFC